MSMDVLVCCSVNASRQCADITLIQGMPDSIHNPRAVNIQDDDDSVHGHGFCALWIKSDGKKVRNIQSAGVM